MRHPGWLVAGVAMLALAAGVGVATWLRQTDPALPGAPEALLSSPLADLYNQRHTLAQYRGKVLVVNFWATWCPPCREEIPVFVAAQRKYGADGLQFVGIALDDPRQVAEFVQELEVNYPVLLGGIHESEILRQLGNPGGGLPYTLIYDRDGRLRETVLGGLGEARLKRLLAPLI